MKTIRKPHPHERPKRPYHAPELRRLGSMTQITQTSGGGPNVDFADGPAIYSS